MWSNREILDIALRYCCSNTSSGVAFRQEDILAFARELMRDPAKPVRIKSVRHYWVRLDNEDVAIKLVAAENALGPGWDTETLTQLVEEKSDFHSWVGEWQEHEVPTA